MSCRHNRQEDLNMATGLVPWWAKYEPNPFSHVSCLSRAESACCWASGSFLSGLHQELARWARARGLAR